MTVEYMKKEGSLSREDAVKIQNDNNIYLAKLAPINRGGQAKAIILRSDPLEEQNLFTPPLTEYTSVVSLREPPGDVPGTQWRVEGEPRSFFHGLPLDPA